LAQVSCGNSTGGVLAVVTDASTGAVALSTAAMDWQPAREAAVNAANRNLETERTLVLEENQPRL
jgi:hypothetical protein